MLIQNSFIVNPKIKSDISKHEEDNRFIEVAIGGNAEYIVSQGKHLLEIKEYKGIKILNPEEFLKIIG